MILLDNTDSTLKKTPQRRITFTVKKKKKIE